jgi:hypothetical protein
MARWHGFNATTKVLGASAVVTFQPTEIPFPVAGRGLAELGICLVDATGTDSIATGIVSNLSRIRVRAGGATIFDCSAYALSELISQLQTSEIGTGNSANALAFLGGAWGLKNSVSIRIPFGVIDAESEDECDLSQFPLGKLPSVELTCTAAMTASSFASMFWTQTDILPLWSPKLLGQAMNVPASAVSMNVQITEPGLIRAVGLNTQMKDVAASLLVLSTGFKKYKIVLAGVEKFYGTPNVLLESARTHMAYPLDMAATTTSVPAMCYAKMVGMLPGPQGTTRLEVDAGAFTGTYTNAITGTPSTGTEYYLWAFDNQ